MRAQQILSNDHLMKFAPSIFATAPWSEVSDKYTFIPTIDIVEALRGEGFLPVFANQSASRIEGKSEFTKHMIRFQRAQDMVDYQLANPGHHFYAKHGQQEPEIAQIVLTNSHDRTSGYRLDAGLFRLICSNGLMAQSSDLGSVSVRHSGNIKDMVIDGCCRIIDDMPKVLAAVDGMKSIKLDTLEQRIFATAALELRWPTDDETGKTDAPIVADKLLSARRAADTGGDLWTTFNRVQENFMKGGLRGIGTTGKRTSTRAIKSVNEDIRMNKALWTLAEQMRALKA